MFLFMQESICAEVYRIICGKVADSIGEFQRVAVWFWNNCIKGSIMIKYCFHIRRLMDTLIVRVPYMDCFNICNKIWRMYETL